MCFCSPNVLSNSIGYAAFIVDADQPVGEMLNLIRNADKKLVRAVEIFDIYSGANIDDGKKSVALSVSIQDDNKTSGIE